MTPPPVNTPLSDRAPGSRTRLQQCRMVISFINVNKFTFENSLLFGIRCERQFKVAEGGQTFVDIRRAKR